MKILCLSFLNICHFDEAVFILILLFYFIFSNCHRTYSLKKHGGHTMYKKKTGTDYAVQGINNIIDVID